MTLTSMKYTQIHIPMKLKSHMYSTLPLMPSKHDHLKQLINPALFAKSSQDNHLLMYTALTLVQSSTTLLHFVT